jgi:predicted XRE-type DNA-binding protein
MKELRIDSTLRPGKTESAWAMQVNIQVLGESAKTLDIQIAGMDQFEIPNEMAPQTSLMWCIRDWAERRAKTQARAALAAIVDE